MPPLDGLRDALLQTHSWLDGAHAHDLVASVPDLMRAQVTRLWPMLVSDKELCGDDGLCDELIIGAMMRELDRSLASLRGGSKTHVLLDSINGRTGLTTRKEVKIKAVHEDGTSSVLLAKTSGYSRYVDGNGKWRTVFMGNDEAAIAATELELEALIDKELHFQLYEVDGDGPAFLRKMLHEQYHVLERSSKRSPHCSSRRLLWL